MIVNKTNTRNTNFNARFNVSQAHKFVGTNSYKRTELDALFKENNAVKSINNLSSFIINNIICKHFDKPTSKLEYYVKQFFYKISFFSRILADRIFLLDNYKHIKNIRQKFLNIDFDSKNYIEEFAKIGNSIDSKYIEINTEDNVLNKIAKSNTSTIFIMNHPNFHKDKFIYLLINSILNKLYVQENKQEICPRPKIFVSRTMLKIVHKKIGELYKKFGMVPVDASLAQRDNMYNTKTIKEIFKEFVDNKTNLFIFPEGNNSSYKNRKLNDKMQIGTAKIISKALTQKKSIRVVPIGIDYSKDKKSLGKIYISKPMYFNIKDKSIFYKKSNGKPQTIPTQNIAKNILNILTENLENSIQKAKTHNFNNKK